MVVKSYQQIRAASRLLFLVGVLSTYAMHGGMLYVLTVDRDRRRQRLSRNAHRYCRYIVKFFGVKVVCANPIAHDEKSLLVGNHVGFVDILCLKTLVPAVFITSKEMRNTPGLGQLCEIAGCTYVDRVNRMKIQDELKDLVTVLKKGFRVVLYAEATASNGEQVLPFKKTLLTAAGLAEVPIRPFVFNFRQVNGEPVQFHHRDALCWYGDIPFLTSIWRSLQLETVTCEIEFLPLLSIKPEDDRTAVSQKLHGMVSEKYVPFVDKSKTTNKF